MDNNPTAFVEILYKKLNELFGSGSQLFSMEFPGRVLDESTYSYPVDSPYSILSRPQVVLEEEFRLANDLFDLYHINSGPNGKKLSTSYELALNALAPKFPTSSDFHKDQNKIRAWLLEEVEDTINNKPFKGTRMELFKQLNEIYLQEKVNWEKVKLDKQEEANNEPDPEKRKKKLEQYTRWLANEAPLREAKIEALFDDAVVRGYYHEVKTDLGYLDIKSASEQLEDAKSRLRSSSMSSLDESETIYPVQFQPLDWSKALSTDFIPEDLTHSADSLRAKLLSKQNELEQLQTERQLLVSSKKGNTEELQKEVENARDEVDKAQTKLLQEFTQAISTVVQMYLKSHELPESPDWENITKEINKEISQYSVGLPITVDNVKEIKDLSDNIEKATQHLEKASRALAYYQMREAESESTDGKQQLIVIDNKINSLNREIKYLQQIITSSIKQKLNAKDSENDDPDKKGDPSQIGLLPTMPSTASRFMDVVINYRQSSSSQKTDLSAGSVHASFSSIFGFAKGSSDTSWSDFASKYDVSTTDIDIGFRATKVTIDRGGWFSPEFFTFTDGMYRILQGDKPISNGIPKGHSEENLAPLRDVILSNYPVSFIVVKDVTISIHLHEGETEDAKKVLQNQNSVVSNILCFASASGSSAYSKSSESHFSGIVDNNLVIKIPGPQILGWFLEFLPKDLSNKNYTKMPEDFLPTTKEEKVKQYEGN